MGWHPHLVLWNSNSTRHWQQGGAGALQVSVLVSSIHVVKEM